MSHKTQAAAVSAGQKALAMMPHEGRGWSMDVWQNCGWHFSLSNGPVSVWATGDEQYHCMVAEEMDEDGTWSHTGGPWTQPSYHRTPWEAVQHEVKLAEDYVAEKNRVWDETLLYARTKITGDPTKGVKQQVEEWVTENPGAAGRTDRIASLSLMITPAEEKVVLMLYNEAFPTAKLKKASRCSALLLKSLEKDLRVIEYNDYDAWQLTDDGIALAKYLVNRSTSI